LRKDRSEKTPELSGMIFPPPKSSFPLSLLFFRPGWRFDPSPSFFLRTDRSTPQCSSVALLPFSSHKRDGDGAPCVSVAAFSRARDSSGDRFCIESLSRLSCARPRLGILIIKVLLVWMTGTCCPLPERPPQYFAFWCFPPP